MANQTLLIQEPLESKHARLAALVADECQIEAQVKHFQGELRYLRDAGKEVRAKIRALAQELADGQQTLAVVEGEGC